MTLSNPLQSGLTDLQRRKLTKLFSMYDAGNTGVLKLVDFQNLVDRFAAVKGLRKDSSEYYQLMDRLMHRLTHLRGEVKEKLGRRPTEGVTLEEWLLFYSQVLSSDSYQDYIVDLTRLIFDAVDTDDSGHLDLPEWKHLFQVYGIPVIYAEEAFLKADLNQDGKLSRADLLQLVKEFYYSQDPEAPGNYIFGPF